MSVADVEHREETEPRYATADDIYAALEGWGDDDDRAMFAIARRWAGIRGLIDQAEDLLNEAYQSLFLRQGDHRWDMNRYSLPVFLERVIKSIASNWDNQLYVDRSDRRLGRRYTSVTADHPETAARIERFPSPQTDQQRAYEARALAEAILRLFDDDADATAAVRLIFTQAKRAEMLEEMSWTLKRYNAVIKKIDRRIKKSGLEEVWGVKLWRVEN